MLENIMNYIHSDLSKIDTIIDINLKVKKAKRINLKSANELWSDYQSIEYSKTEQRKQQILSIKQKYDLIVQKINVLKNNYTNLVQKLNLKQSSKIEVLLKVNLVLKHALNKAYEQYIALKDFVNSNTQKQSWSRYLINRAKKNPIALKILHSNLNLQYHKKRSYSISIRYATPSFCNNYFIFNKNSILTQKLAK